MKEDIYVDAELGLQTVQPRLHRASVRPPELRTFLPHELVAWKKRTGGSVHFTPDGVALTAANVTRNFKSMAAAIAAVA